MKFHRGNIVLLHDLYDEQSPYKARADSASGKLWGRPASFSDLFHVC